MPSFHPQSALPDPQAYALVLAAGSGVRFGGRKLLAPLRGRPLISHVATTVAEAVAKGHLAGGLAVIPAGDTTLVWTLETAGITVVTNAEAEQGMSTSLRRGLTALAESALRPQAAAAVVLLGDQPEVRSDAIARLVDSWRANGRSVRPRYTGTPDAPGHPVVLDRALWSLAGQLTGDRGLGSLLEGRSDVLLVDMPGTNPDVDTVEDLDRLEQHGRAGDN